jgi:hypothetical protein
MVTWTNFRSIMRKLTLGVLTIIMNKQDTKSIGCALVASLKLDLLYLGGLGYKVALEKVKILLLTFQILYHIIINLDLIYIHRGFELIILN